MRLADTSPFRALLRVLVRRRLLLETLREFWMGLEQQDRSWLILRWREGINTKRNYLLWYGRLTHVQNQESVALRYLKFAGLNLCFSRLRVHREP